MRISADDKSACVVVRADAGTRMGAGHVMRCLALAQAWQAYGATVTFLSRCESDALRRRIESAGSGFIPLEKSWPDLSDLDLTRATVGELSARGSCRPWLVLDGYHFDPAYQQAARGGGCRVLVVDDTAQWPKYHADVLLNQNMDAERLPYSHDPDTLLLLGTRYVLLRPEFLAWRGWRREVPEVARRVLITLGGGDAENVTQKVIQALQQVTVEGLEVTVAVGAGNPHLEKLDLATRGARFPTRLVRDAPDMAELMARADVAVSAGGSTGWELAFMGLPSLMLVLAENQRSVAEGLDEAGVAVNLGLHEQVTVARIAEELAALCHDHARRRKLSLNGQELIDGMGTQRVLTVMSALDDRVLDEDRLRLRRATPQDAEMIWRLANDPGVRGNSFNPEPIPLDHHLRWYNGKLSSPDSRMWVLELGGVIVAQVRYDLIDSDTVEVHFAVAPNFRGKGLGTTILKLTGHYACKEMGARRVRGVVHSHNTPSKRAFLKAAFAPVAQVQKQGRSCDIFEWECP